MVTTMASEGAVPQKQEDSIFKSRKGFVDRIKEDGIRKELYENERKARENWELKWGFLKNPRQLWEKEAENRGLPSDIFEKKNIERQPPCWPKERQPIFEVLPSKAFPQISSGVIGWRSSAKENNLDSLAGPLYVSPTRTMNPPLQPDEPDLRHQKFIFLG